MLMQMRAFFVVRSKEIKTSVKKIVRTVLLHDAEELDNDLGGRTDQDLALASLLGVVDGVKRIVKDGGLDHFGGVWRFSVAAEGD